MNFRAILHLQDSQYCYALDERTVRLMLRVSSEDKFGAIDVVYGNKYDYYLVQQSAAMEKIFSDRNFDYYMATIQLQDVRFVYVFRLEYDGKIYYFSEDGISRKYDFSLAYYNSFQLPYINRADILPTVQWFKNAVFYEIFIDRFCMGESGKDKSYINLKWGAVPNPKSFAGGDLYGIREKLGYLKELGVTALYLTPIFKSVSNHKYDISDYYEVDEHFGDKDILKKLITEAHSMGIKVVLDAVFNHCSEKLAQFQDVAKNGKNSPYFDWFIIHGDRIENANYEYFGVCTYMPKLNTSNEGVKNFLTDIGLYWIRQFDIDGWRLDVSDEVSHDFWRHFRKEVKKVKPDCIILGENWHDSYPYLHGDQFDGIMNYALTKACLDYFVNDAFDSQGFAKRLSELYVRNTKQVNDMMLNLIDSHDTHRFYTLAEKDKDKLICALAIIFMHTGSPCIYYGTEVPLEGGYDPDCRRCMEWDVPRMSVYPVIKALAALRGREEIEKGDITFNWRGGLFLLERTAERTLRLVISKEKQKQNYKPEGNILLSHNYGGGCFSGTGFIIEEL